MHLLYWHDQDSKGTRFKNLDIEVAGSQSAILSGGLQAAFAALKPSHLLDLASVSTFLDARTRLSHDPHRFDAMLVLIKNCDHRDVEHIKSLHSHSKATPIIVMSADDSIDFCKKVLSAGAHDVVPWDSNIEHIVRSILFAIERARGACHLTDNFDQLDRVLDSAGLGVWDWFIDTGESEINEHWASIAGYKPRELRPFTIEKLTAMMPKEDERLVMEQLKRHWSGETEIYRAEYRIYHKDGHLVWVEDTGKVIEWNHDGSPLRMVGTHQDISQRKADQDNLKKLSRIASESTNGVVITDIKGRIEWVNEGFSRITGYSQKEAQGKTPGALLAGAGTDPKISNVMGDAVRAGQGFNVEILNYHREGHEYWVAIECSALLDDDGALQGFMAIETDITEQKTAALEVKRQKKMLEQMSQLGRIGAWEVDLEKETVYWSSMTKEIHGVSNNYEPDLSTAIKFYKEGYSRSTIQALVEQAIETGRCFSAELQMVTAKGRHIWIATRGITQMEGGECKRILGSLQEITERKLIETQLIEAKESAESGTKAKSEFLASMSHEIRTPINGVIGALHLLNRSELKATQKRHASLALRSADSLLALINDILDFSKIEAGKMEIEAVEFDLMKMLGEFSHAIALRVHEKDLEFVVDTSQVSHALVLGDPNRLEQILNNLISNAAKFTELGEIMMCCKTQKRGDRIRLEVSVADTGIGIPLDKQSTLFSSFTQVDNTNTRKFGGTGLGLAISRKLCHAMDGEINLQSVEGEGSEFSFSIELGAVAKAESRLPYASMQGINVLVVDDNKSARDTLKRLLTDMSATVFEASSSRQAKDFIEQDDAAEKKLDLVFIDHFMPETDGLQLAEWLKRTGVAKHFSMVLMADSLAQLEELEILNGGFSACIMKPCRADEIVLSLYKTKLRDRVAFNLPHEGKGIDAGDMHYLVDECEDWQEDVRVLLVEDNFINQEVVLGLLDDHHFLVATANNGLEAIEKLDVSEKNGHPYTLVLMDCLMPMMDGYEATLKIRNSQGSYRDIPIIAMTANAMKGDREKCLSVGMSDYLSKPLNPEELQKKLAQWIPRGQSSLQELNKDEESESKPEAHAPRASDQLIWDYARILKRVNNKDERVSKLAKMFVSDMPSKMEDLSEAVEREDLEATKTLLHTIKGISANMSANQVAELSASLEEVVRQGEWLQLKRELPELAKVHKSTLDQLQNYLHNNPTL